MQALLSIPCLMLQMAQINYIVCIKAKQVARRKKTQQVPRFANAKTSRLSKFNYQGTLDS